MYSLLNIKKDNNYMRRRQQKILAFFTMLHDLSLSAYMGPHFMLLLSIYVLYYNVTYIYPVSVLWK